MERSIFVDKRVYSSFEKDFVLVAQYTDDQSNPKPAEVLKRYAGEGVAVPLYMVLDSDGNEIARLTPPNNIATLTTEEFIQFLEEGKTKYQTGT